MKNLTTLLISIVFIATFGFGQPTMTIATTMAITPEVTTFAGSDIDGEARDDWSGVSVSMNSDGDRAANPAPPIFLML